MFGKIVYISDNMAHVEMQEGSPVATDLMNMHVVFEDADHKVMGEIEDIDAKLMKIRFLGEIINGRFVGGVLKKPTLASKIRIISKEEVPLIMGEDSPTSFILGTSPLYDNYPVRVDVNGLCAGHMAIFGNTGSGKSCGVARLLQNIFTKSKVPPYRSNFFIFDAYGEYHNAFKNINQINPNYNFKYYTTNKADTEGEKLCIPLWLLDVDDMTLLLSATSHSQIPIIERMLKVVSIFSKDDEFATNYKNHLIAKAIMTILYTNQTASSKRNDVFAIIASCSTSAFNLEAPVQGLGYTRKFRDCFMIDTHGNFPESNLMTEYITSFIKDELDEYEPGAPGYYTLKDLEKALDFTLISEGFLRNDATHDEAVTLKVRLHSIAIGDYARFFDYPQYITRDNYIASLVSIGNRKAQIINFNFEDVEDWFTKVINKVYCKMLFNFCKGLPNRASIPFHIYLEEAHRVVQNDSDVFMLGYNIFERIAKEGRKYGILLNLISQRPVELSETVISQISNFMIFKMNHPRDLDYIRKMLPNISAEIVEKQKSLQSGTCVGFGTAFKVPLIIKMEMPNPAPSSGNCDVATTWSINRQ